MTNTVLFSTKKVFRDFQLHGLEGADDVVSKISLAECARLVRGNRYKGVQLYFLDLSTDSETGTFKDWVACTTVAHCVAHNIKEYVTQSSGNTANALARYSAKHGIVANIFYLKSNSYKLNPTFVSSGPFIKLHEVDADEPKMKEFTQRFSKQSNIPWLPDLNIQIAGNAVRADVVLSAVKNHGVKFDWVSQSLSSGYGVFGFYDGLRRLKINSKSGFSFLGVQQSTVCPFIKRFEPDLLNGIILDKEQDIETTLFRSVPTEKLYELMASIQGEYGGGYSVVTNQSFDARLDEAVSMLSSAGIVLTKSNSGNYIEKSGIIDLIGTLDAIDRGVIKSAQNVLVSITGGCGPLCEGRINPDFKYE